MDQLSRFYLYSIPRARGCREHGPEYKGQRARGSRTHPACLRVTILPTRAPCSLDPGPCGLCIGMCEMLEVGVPKLASTFWISSQG